MNARIVDPTPGGEWEPIFRQATITVVQIGDDWIPDYGEPVPDMALVEVQRAMHGEPEQLLENVRGHIDWPPIASRKRIGLKGHGPGTASDVALVAILNAPDSPFGICYHWAPGVLPICPDGLTVVFWRQRLYTRTGDTLRLWRDDQ